MNDYYEIGLWPFVEKNVVFQWKLGNSKGGQYRLLIFKGSGHR